jgi:hypothetical protein
VEALYSLWQEAKRKDIERFFGVFKKKFCFFSKAIPFAFVEDVIEAFYTCLILHNMAVAERVSSDDFINEADVVYDFVQPMDNDANAQALPRDNMALQFVQLQKDDVNNRLLEVKYLCIRDPRGRFNSTFRDRANLHVTTVSEDGPVQVESAL